MRELIDLKMMWAKFLTHWRTPVGAVVSIILAVVFGMLLKEKLITDDCKFMGTFRDGVYSYNCSARVR